MRMWKVNPRLMCRKHLLGEHVEMHMFIGTIMNGKSVQGYLDNQLVEMHNIWKRHEELVREMKRRGYNHNSPLANCVKVEAGYVDVRDNIEELKRRCKDCRRRMVNGK